MKYIKSFESRRILNRSQIEQDINGILVELTDIGIQNRITYVGNWSNGVMIYLDKEDNEVFNTSDIKEYLLTIEDYFKEHWSNISIRYDLENILTNLSKTEDSLEDDETITKVTLEIKKI